MQDWSGTFGAQTTADEAVADVDLSGQLVIVTGANSGIGFHTARALASADARVIFACRDSAAGAAAVERTMAAHPEAIAEVGALDLGSRQSIRDFAERIDDEPERISVLITVGLENYLDFMEIPVLAGRGFTPTDTRDAPPVGIVNEAMAQVLWPGTDALGKRVRSYGAAPWVEIIGVARNVQHQGLMIDTEPKLYLPAEKSARTMNAWVLRIRGDVGATIDLARSAVSAQSSTTPVRSVQILEETISASAAVPRFRTFFVVGLSAAAAVLALLGVYGVMTFAVTQRTKEIAVRMALGANVDGLVRGVVGSGLKLAVTGVAAGLLIALPAAGRLEAFLFGVGPTDVIIYYLTIGLGVTAVSGLAAYLPARRAATVDPVSVLNSE